MVGGRVRSWLVGANTVGDNLRRVQRFVHDLGERLVPAEVLVVQLGVASWKDPAKVRHSIELSHCIID